MPMSVRNFAVASCLILAVFALAACGGKTVQRIDTDTTVDLSGRWNDTDSRMVSEEMVTDVLARPWLPRYQANHEAERPTVIVGLVRNRSNEHIPTETFTKDIERSFVNSGLVRVVSINSITDEEGGDKVVYYQVDLELHDIETNEKVWIGTKEIKKFIGKGKFKA